MSHASPALAILDARPALIDLPRGNLFVVEGKVGLERPRGPLSVIGRGLVVAPPLVDAHAHLSVRDGRTNDSGWNWAAAASEADQEAQSVHALRTNAAAGVLAVRDAGGASSIVARMSLASGPNLPWLQASGRIVTGPGRYAAGIAYEVVGSDVAAAVRSESRVGGKWVKLVADGSHRDRPDEEPACDWTEPDVRAAVSAAHQAGARVIYHALTSDAARLGLSADIDSVEHGWGLSDDDLEAMASRGIAWTPTAQPMLESYADATRSEGSAPSYLSQARDRLPALIGHAATTGVRILCGTDLGLPHGAVAREMLALIDLGLPREQALRAATLDAWTYLGLPPLILGGVADLLVLDADPMERPDTYLAPVAVVRGGRLVLQRHN